MNPNLDTKNEHVVVANADNETQQQLSVVQQRVEIGLLIVVQVVKVGQTQSECGKEGTAADVDDRHGGVNLHRHRIAADE